VRADGAPKTTPAGEAGRSSSRRQRRGIEVRIGGRAAPAFFLDPGERVAAVAIAEDVAARLRDHERVATAMARASRQTSLPESVQWTPAGLAGGNVGLALLSGYLEF